VHGCSVFEVSALWRTYLLLESMTHIRHEESCRCALDTARRQSIEFNSGYLSGIPLTAFQILLRQLVAHALPRSLNTQVFLSTR
jgi:hypothetical protein